MPHFFISYRRSDKEGRYLAHMISRELRRRYGPTSTFLDVISSSPGLSFPEKVDRALRATDVVLVIIGSSWLQRLKERVGDLRDWVRYEISESLKRDSLPVVPVCLAGVEMPCPEELPEELRSLYLSDAFTLDPSKDVEAQLVRLLTRLGDKVEALRDREWQVARGKLIALLRWKAHQLNLRVWEIVEAQIPRFFISYRPGDQEGQYLAYMISGELRRRYGPASIFMDIDVRIPGFFFRAKVGRVLKVADYVLVIIGPLWLQHLTERVRDPWDWVHREVSESLKRKQFPVVPVYLAGVKLLDEDELPKDLHDLCLRDAAVIDPFQDFENHLARLLSPLDDMHQEKKALQAARVRLITLLRRRARHLVLVEERKSLRLKLAEVRHASAARETARAAREAERAAQAADWKGWERSEVRIAKRVEEPDLASNPASHGTTGGVGLSLFASVLVSFALAFGYSHSLLGLPFVQGNFILTFIYAFFSGLATSLILCWRKVRRFEAAAFVGVASGLAAVYLSWAVWIYAYFGLFKEQGFAGLFSLVASPGNLWRYLYHLNGVGSWDIWGYKPTGFVLWILWSLEAAVIIGLSSLLPPFIVMVVDEFTNESSLRPVAPSAGSSTS